MANADITSTDVVLPTEVKAQAIYDRYRVAVVPYEHAPCLADIINAGWLGYEDANIWANIPRIGKERERVLKELVLKNIQVFEFESCGGST